MPVPGAPFPLVSTPSQASRMTLDPEKFMPSNMCKAAELQLLRVGLQTLNLTEIVRLRQKRSIVLTGRPGGSCSLTHCYRFLWDVFFADFCG